MEKLTIALTFIGFLIAGVLAGAFINMAATTTEPDLNATTINLYKDRAVPDAVEVKRGEKVAFVSKDGEWHSIGEGKGNDFGHAHEHEEIGIASGKFGPDEAYVVEFKKNGVYNLHDHLNPNIFAVIIVHD